MLAQSRAMAHPGSSIPDAVRYFPIVFFEAFLTLTVVVFAFGPWDWPVTNPVTLYSFLFINQLALLFGYLQAVRGRSPSRFRLPLTPKELVWLMSLTTLATLIPTVKHATGGEANFNLALTDPGQAYKITNDAAHAATYSIWAYVMIVLSPLIWPLLPLAVVFWKKLSPTLKVLAVLGIVSDAAIYFLKGTNKGMVDVLILMPWLIILQSKNPAQILSPKRVIRFFLLFAIAASLFLPYFGLNILGRMNSESIGGLSIHGEGSVQPTPIQIPGLEGPLGNAYAAGMTELTSYVGQGYYGLSLALQEPFEWTYGVGHSPFFSWLAEKAMGKQLHEIDYSTYPWRVDRDFGWRADVQWISIYPWFAGDVTFFGVPFVMFLFGRLLGLTWIDAIGGNPAAVVVFSLTALTLYYTSANAQVFRLGETVCPFYFYLLWWIKSAKNDGPKREYVR
jgi:hypothetical protein